MSEDAPETYTLDNTPHLWGAYQTLPMDWPWSELWDRIRGLEDVSLELGPGTVPTKGLIRAPYRAWILQADPRAPGVVHFYEIMKWDGHTHAIELEPWGRITAEQMMIGAEVERRGEKFIVLDASNNVLAGDSP